MLVQVKRNVQRRRASLGTFKQWLSYLLLGALYWSIVLKDDGFSLGWKFFGVKGGIRLIGLRVVDLETLVLVHKAIAQPRFTSFLHCGTLRL